MRKLAIIATIFISLTFSSTALAINTAQEPSSTNNSVKHVVKAKETISGIASFYHVTIESIVSLNKLSSPDKLQIGQTLIIPSKDASSNLTPVKNNNTPATEIKSEKYVVKARDTFTSIAKSKGITVAELIAANKTVNPNSLKIGQAIIVPASKQDIDLASRKDDRTRDAGDAEGEQAETDSDNLAVDVIDYAKEFLGRPYSYGSSGPNSFDCSGFTMFVFSHFDIDLPHSSASQSDEGTHVKRDELLPGDLVFFKTSKKGISHVGIYVGDGDFIHASTGGGEIEISPLSETYYDKRYVTARRILE